MEQNIFQVIWNIQPQPQVQCATSYQLAALKYVAEKLGLLDAAGKMAALAPASSMTLDRVIDPKVVAAIPDQEEHSDISLNKQLRYLTFAATRFGLYDAADILRLEGVRA